MGVVRREGDWRLEKRDEGVYEITYRQNPQVKVYTADYDPDPTEIPAVDVLPVREVDGYGDAEALFEERASGPPPAGPDTGGRPVGPSR